MPKSTAMVMKVMAWSSVKLKVPIIQSRVLLSAHVERRQPLARVGHTGASSRVPTTWGHSLPEARRRSTAQQARRAGLSLPRWPQRHMQTPASAALTGDGHGLGDT